MATVVIVDGGDVCRGPVVAYTLRQQLTEAAALAGTDVLSRGLAPQAGSPMCGRAASRLGWSGPAIAFLGAHRATALGEDDVVDADLVLAADRIRRTAIERLAPSARSRVFSLREAVVLAAIVTDRVAHGALETPRDLPALARALHAARGTVPMIEPRVRTGLFHRRRPAGTGPRTPDEHDGEAMHAHVTEEAQRLALTFAARAADLARDRVAPNEAVRPGLRLRRA